jgi:hypothetical protein
MPESKPTYVWYGSDHADAYLLAAALHLARATQGPLTVPLPPPSVSATLYCAFAAEAYVNVALLRLLDETEYRPVSQVGVRTKYFLVTRLGVREEWFSRGEQTLEDLDELFTQRNRLVHAQPTEGVLHPFSDPQNPDLHNDLRNVARWLAATIDAVLRLSRSHAELGEFARVAGPLAQLEPTLRRFERSRDGPALDGAVRVLLRTLLAADHDEMLDEDELSDLIESQDPDWDVRELGADA